MLNRTGEYALKATVYITQTEDDWPVSGPRIARHTSIPAKYLSMVLGTLVRRGILDATRGKKGGFRFKQSPDRVRLLDIVAPFDPQFSDTQKPCPFGNTICNDANPCGGHKSYKRITEGFLAFLTRTSIAKVANAPGTARHAPRSKTTKLATKKQAASKKAKKSKKSKKAKKAKKTKKSARGRKA